MRMEANITPSVAAEPFSSTKQALKQDVDLLVLDGRPDSDTTSLDCAKIADLVLIPTGEALDDLKPQVLFAHELKSRGIPTNKLLFVVNNAKSDISVSDAQRYINEANFSSTENSLGARTGYTIAQNRGLAVSETSYPSLNERADILASEIVEKATQLSRSSI
jgi:chromosome partitioning protein